MRGARTVALLVDQRLGSLRWSDDGVVGLDLFPASERVVDELTGQGIRVWLIADVDATGARVLARWLPNVTGVRPLKGGGAAALAALLKRLGADGVLSAADRVRRAAAREAGWAAVADPAIAAWVLDGHEPCLARIDAGDDTLDRLPHLLVAERDDRGVLGFTTADSLAAAAVAGATVQRLPIDLSRQDAVWVRTSSSDREEVIAALAGRTVLAARDGNAMVAVDAGDDLADPALHAAHGHFGLVAPTPAASTRPKDASLVDAELIRWPWPDRPEVIVDLPPVWLPPCHDWEANFTDDVERYAGLRSLDASGPIVSRHVRHPDNDRAVYALLADLRAIGYCPWVHTFAHAGRTVRNVLADLPARGRFVRAEILESLRRVLTDPAVLRDPRKLATRLTKQVPSEALDHLVDADLDPDRLHKQLRHATRIYPWLPWWHRLCLLPGLGAGIIVVGCHLDSTASRDQGYSPSTGPAPGADDNASGIAGTLAVARWMWPMRHTLTHTVRFAFFNAEEEGLVGSAAYATHLASFWAPVEAVVCMDMIGFNSDAQSLFEVHAGSPNAAIRDASEPIAHRVAAWTTTLGELPAPQIYRGTNPSGGADRDLNDGAIGRSDHASFQANGYPAVVVTEDFFANLASEPGADANPSYHRSADSGIDADYGAAIACVVAHTARDLAINGL